MTELIFTSDMPKKFAIPAELAFEAIGNDFYEVSGGKAWIRVSLTPRNSIYFQTSIDNTIIVNIEGNAISRFYEHAVAYWGLPYYQYYYEKQNKEYLKWRVNEDDFYSYLKQVMLGVDIIDTDSILIVDIEGIYKNKGLRIYEKKALAKQRIGHSLFAKNVKNRANNACLVNPIIKQNLIASHIKPWAESHNEEKTDIANGLCLSPNFDGLFENGYISFNDDGSILIGAISKLEQEAYGLTGYEIIELMPEQKKYLNWHRNNKFVAS